MTEQTGIQGVKFHLLQHGYHASAIALVDSQNTHYFGWYKEVGFLDDERYLEHIGAMVRSVSDSQPEPREELSFGTPNRPIFRMGDIRFRHLSLEEIARFQAGFSNPDDHIDPENKYDYINGKPKD